LASFGNFAFSLILFAAEIHVDVHHFWHGDHLALAGGLEALKFMQRVVARPHNLGSVT